MAVTAHTHNSTEIIQPLTRNWPIRKRICTCISKMSEVHHLASFASKQLPGRQDANITPCSHDLSFVCSIAEQRHFSKQWLFFRADTRNAKIFCFTVVVAESPPARRTQLLKLLAAVEVTHVPNFQQKTVLCSLFSPNVIVP